MVEEEVTQSAGDAFGSVSSQPSRKERAATFDERQADETQSNKEEGLGHGRADHFSMRQHIVCKET